MAENKANNESEKKAYEFSSIKSAIEYIVNLDLNSLSEKRGKIDSYNAVLDDSNEHTAVAIRKILSSKVHANREPLKAKFQTLFDIRATKDLSVDKKASNLRKIEVLKRAMRTATDKDANDRGLWEFDYSVTCNTIKNNGIAKFSSINHKTDDGDDDGDNEKEAPVVTDVEQVFNYVIHRMSSNDFKNLASIVQTRFVLEQQNYDSKDIIFVEAYGKKPAHFKLKESA
mgnify:CR=1 FL=1